MSRKTIQKPKEPKYKKPEVKEKSVVKGNLWIWGMIFNPGENEYSYCNFGSGVEIKSIGKRKASGEMRILVTAEGIKNGCEELEYRRAVKKYPFLSK